MPNVLGACSTDLTTLASYANPAQERLILAFGEQGFYGAWQKVTFNVARCTSPYITLPAEIARIIALDVCRTPVPIRNQWFEYMDVWEGYRTEYAAKKGQGSISATDIGYYPTVYDLPANSKLRVYATDARDYGQVIYFQGATDSNGNQIYDAYGAGTSLTLAAPFSTSGFVVASFVGVQKLRTYGDVSLYAVDAAGVETFLARYKAYETTPSYRRYLLTGMPAWCCECTLSDTARTYAQVNGIAKMQHVPVVNQTDFFVIQSIPALIQECAAIRYEEMDTPQSAQLAIVHHAKAVQLLNQQLNHEQGAENPTVNFAPFGLYGSLQAQRIGMA